MRSMMSTFCTESVTWKFLHHHGQRFLQSLTTIKTRSCTSAFRSKSSISQSATGPFDFHSNSKSLPLHVTDSVVIINQHGIGTTPTFVLSQAHPSPGVSLSASSNTSSISNVNTDYLTGIQQGQPSARRKMRIGIVCSSSVFHMATQQCCNTSSDFEESTPVAFSINKLFSLDYTFLGRSLLQYSSQHR